MAEPSGLANRKLEFRTMLKTVADQLRPEDVESLAFIHHLPATEPKTALGALSWMERKGMFSFDNVDALVQLLGRICRCDITYNCGVKEYQEQHWEPERLSQPERLEPERLEPERLEPERLSQPERLEPERLEPERLEPERLEPERLESPEVQGSSGGSNRDSDSTAAGLKPQLLTNEQALSDPTPPNPDQAVTHGPSFPHSLTSTQDTPPDQATPKDVHSGSELSSPADDTDLLSGLSREQKMKLLERIASDEVMRTELFSMVGQQCPLASQVGSHPDLPHPLHRDIDTLRNINGATAVPVAGPNVTASGLPGNSRSFPAGCTPSVAVGPPVGGRPPKAGDPPAVGPPVGGRPPKSGDPPAGSSSIAAAACASHAPVPSLEHTLRDHPLQKSVQTDVLSWKIRKSCLAKLISSQRDKTLSKQLKIRAVGCRAVTLTLILHACGIKHDKNNSASLEVLVAVNNSRKCQPLKQMARVNLEITVQMAEGREFLATKSVCRELDDFCIHDFLPHEVIRDPERKAQNVEMKAEAYLRFDTRDSPVPECEITADGWVAPQASTTVQQH